MLTEPAAKALIESWLGAQNQGDFKSYEQLYAKRFTGVKRSGERTRRFGRSTWMSDRAKMFRRPMKVGVQNLRLDLGSSVARARFDQTWSSGTYSDTGQKELLLVVDAGALRIGREEMLASTIHKDHPVRSVLELRMVDEGLLVLREYGSSELGMGPLRDRGGDSGVMEVARNVDVARLPAAVRAKLGAPLQVIAADGQICATTIRAFEMRGQVIPHFSFGRDENGDLVDRPLEKALQEIWELSDRGGRDLVGVLDPPCQGGLWALDSGDPLPKIYTPRAADGAVLTAAMKLFERLPEYKALQASYREYHPGAREPWYEGSSGRREAKLFQPESGHGTLLISAFGGDGCDDFYGALSAVFEVSSGSAPKLALLGALEKELFDPVSAFDLDGDGHLEIINGYQKFRDLISYDGKALESTELLSVTNLDCPC